MGRALLALALSLRGHDKPQKQPLMVSLAIPGTYILDSTLSSLLSSPLPSRPRLSPFHRRAVTTFAETAIHHSPARSATRLRIVQRYERVFKSRGGQSRSRVDTSIPYYYPRWYLWTSTGLH